MPETTPRLGVIPDLAEELYHADPGSISASGAKTLLRSPAHFLHERTYGRAGTRAMDLGTVAHELILGTGRGYVAVEGNRNAKAVKEEIAKHEADGKVVLKPDDLAAAERMADAVLSHPMAGQILTSPGQSELSMFWRDPAYDVIRRCRWDRFGDDGVGVDLKSARSADPEKLAKPVLDFGYEISAAWYSEIAAGLGVELAAYVLVFVESAEPHCVVVRELDDWYFDRGAELAKQALEIYRHCLDTGEWPGYDDEGFATLPPPRWAQRDGA